MRTTVNLDEDIAAKLRAEARKHGKSFQKALNDALRRALLEQGPGARRRRFRVKARSLGKLRPGVSLDDIADLLIRVEGEHRR